MYSGVNQFNRRLLASDLLRIRLMNAIGHVGHCVEQQKGYPPKPRQLPYQTSPRGLVAWRLRFDFRCEEFVSLIAEGHQSFIQAICIVAPLRVHSYSEAIPTQRSKLTKLARILCRSFTPKRHRQLRVKDLPKVYT